MRSISLVLSLILISLSIYAQKTERYSGAYYNGETIKGEANFTFYKNKSGNKIKHGPFRYSAREKGKDWRYSHSISGEYTNGNKDGAWTYNLNSKNRKKDKEGYYFDIVVDMSANYINGLPDGEWIYSCYISKYKMVSKAGRLRKAASKDAKDIKITLHWNKGKLTDSLTIIDQLKGSIIASMNPRGVLMGDFIISNNKHKTITHYDKGIETNSKNDNTIKQNEEYLAFLNLKDTKSEVKKRKQSLFRKSNCIISKYLDDNIFNNKYFLYKYIEGDKLIKSKLDYGDYKVNYKGLYYYTLEPVLNAEEIKIVKNINIAEEKTKESYWYNVRALKKSPKDKKLLADKRRVDSALKKYKNLQCNISIYKKHLSLLAILSDKSCQKLHFDTPPLTRIDYLNQIKRESDKQYKILSTYNQYY